MDSLRSFDISSPELTAVWEMKLRELEEGSLTVGKLVRDMDDYTVRLSDQIRNAEFSRVSGTYLKVKCPICGGRMKSLSNYYICEHHKKENGCPFVIPKELNGAQIKDKMVEDICEGGTSKAVKMKSRKTGKDFYAGMHFNPETKKVEFVFEDGHETKYKCPVCGKLLKKKNGSFSDYLFCPGNDFRLSYIIAKRKLKEAEMKELLNKGEIKLDGFVSKKGTEFSSKLIIKEGKVQFCFDTERSSEELVLPSDMAPGNPENS